MAAEPEKSLDLEKMCTRYGLAILSKLPYIGSVFELCRHRSDRPAYVKIDIVRCRYLAGSYYRGVFDDKGVDLQLRAGLFVVDSRVPPSREQIEYELRHLVRWLVDKHAAVATWSPNPPAPGHLDGMLRAAGDANYGLSVYVPAEIFHGTPGRILLELPAIIRDVEKNRAKALDFDSVQLYH